MNYKIKSLFKFLKTNSLSRSQLNYDDGNIKNIHYGDIHKIFKTILNCQNEEIPYINKDVPENKIKKDFCKDGDLIVADASEDYEDIGKSIEIFNIQNEKIVSGLHTIILRSKEKDTFAPMFKGYLFQTENVKKQIKVYANGVSVLGIGKKDISKININIPSFEEQKKIGKFIYQIDKKIELMEKKHTLYLDIKKYFMKNMFCNKLNLKPKIRFPEFTEEWVEYKLGDITFIPKKEKIKRLTSNEKLLTVKLHAKGICVNENIKPKLSKKGRPYYKRYSNELLIGRQNFHNGGLGLIPQELNGGICSNAISSFCVKKEKILLKFLYYNLSRKNYYTYCEKYVGGTGQKEFSEKQLLKLKVKIPEIAEQKKIIEFL
ncbi:hypothetical protein BGI41_05855, partial [Methanobrevibacter sp. 87.7]|uniref:restriction endonuclease subunit S n=1 Tax=Methanobrevibacter sp. 87.7 TaxID=387957 RepID=UPI000B503094